MDRSPTVRRWWSAARQRDGLLPAIASLTSACWRFLRDSTPARKRQRYGDVDFDWDQRVDTTSATVPWRDRLLGELHSPYQPTEPGLFHEMMGCLKIDFRQFVFVDLGSGKGRTLLMAAEYPFHKIVGVELLPSLHRIAVENIARHTAKTRGETESICGDAQEFIFPRQPMVLYLFNPLPEAGLRRVVANLEASLRETPRPLFILYHNPLSERPFLESAALAKVGGTHQYVVFAGHAAHANLRAQILPDGNSQPR